MSEERTMADLADDDTPTEETVSAGFTYKSPAVWELHGPAKSEALDMALMFAVEIGLDARIIRAGSYRVWGTLEALAKLAEYLTTFKISGVGLHVERPPEGLHLQFETTPARAPARFAVVHGQHQIERPVTRAVDVGLRVVCIGQKRFRVTGASRLHVAWMCTLFEVPEARALEIMNATPEQIAAEDAALPMPEIKVELPTRETLSEITRDFHGDITKVVQVERSVTP